MISNPALAEAKQLTYTLSPAEQESFSSFIEQAKLLTVKIVNQTFAENNQTTEVSVKILGERNGQQVPLMFLNVSRYNWQKQPQLNLWTRYFADSAMLLGMLNNQRVIASRTASVKPVAKLSEFAASHQEANFYK